MPGPTSDVRIAWFSPFPPVRTGVAACSAELVTALAARGWQIDRYPEPAAHDFPWRHARHPYGLIVYQFGNSSHHDYAWPYAFRYPGLVVLHDTRLHHARAALLLRERRADDYRAELAWNEPAVPADAAELAIAGFDSRLYYEWPMVRSLVERSRLVAVHGEATRRELVARLSEGRDPDHGSASDERIVSIRLGHGQLLSAEQESRARATIRARYTIAQDATVFGVFGGLTPEKRLTQILAAFRATLAYAPRTHLLLGGALPTHADLSAAAYVDVADRVTLTGYIAEDELTDHIAAVDVSLNLRWPTARETSGPWLRALAAGKPTVIVDLIQYTDVATLDPRTWSVRPVGVRAPARDTPRSDLGSRRSARDAVAVAIDILDEDHSLRLAMRRLATDADLRATLGRASREFWRRSHSIEAMTDDYELIMHQARERRGTRQEVLPPHLRRTGDETLHELLKPFGLQSPLGDFA